MGTELVGNRLSRGTNQLGTNSGGPNVRGPYGFGTKCVTAHSIDSVPCESKTLGILHHVAGKCDSEIGATTVCIELKTLNDQILIP